MTVGCRRHVGSMTVHGIHRPGSVLVALEKLFGAEIAEIVERGAQPFVRPVPPGKRLHPPGHRGGETFRYLFAGTPPTTV